MPPTQAMGNELADNVVVMQRLHVAREADVASAVLYTYAQVKAAGGNIRVATEVATMVSELSTNILKYAGHGSITIRQFHRQQHPWLELVAQDQGPGMQDVVLALTEHYSTQGTLGVGLPGVKRMADEFEISSEPGKGTRVCVGKRIT